MKYLEKYRWWIVAALAVYALYRWEKKQEATAATVATTALNTVKDAVGMFFGN